MTRVLKIAAAIVCLTALAAGAGTIIQRKKAALAQAPRYGQSPTPVWVAKARLGSLEIRRDYLAVVEPARTADLQSRLTSRIEAIAVNESELVRKDQPLIVLDDREITHTIDVVRAQIAQTEAEYSANEATVSSLQKSVTFWEREAERMKRLLTTGASSISATESVIDKTDQFSGQLAAARHKGDALKRQISALESRIDELDTRKSYCTITSPFDGTVTQRRADPGDQAAPGKTLLVLEDRSHLKLAFDIPQQDIPLIRTGMTVHFSVADMQRSASVTTIFPALNAARMIRAEVVLNGASTSELDCGAYVPITVKLKTHDDVTLVPASALIESPTGDSHVFLIEAGKLRPVKIVVLGRSGDDVAVAGVAPGTNVVVSTFLGWSQLSADLPVEVFP